MCSYFTPIYKFLTYEIVYPVARRVRYNYTVMPVECTTVSARSVETDCIGTHFLLEYMYNTSVFVLEHSTILATPC